MMDSINQRIARVVKYSDRTIKEFSRAANIPYASLYACINDIRPANLEMVQKIVIFLPEIEERWLLIGEGEMLSLKMIAALKRNDQ